MVADTIPPAICTIPPSSPMYHVRFVYISARTRIASISDIRTDTWARSSTPAWWSRNRMVVSGLVHPKRRRVHQSTQIGFGSLIELGLSRGQGLPPLDEAEHCLLDAGVATLRWYSGSSWNAIHPGLAFGFVGIPAV